MTREWAREMYERDMAYQVYAALRDGVNGWAEIDPDGFVGGWYGRDWGSDESVGGVRTVGSGA